MLHIMYGLKYMMSIYSNCRNVFTVLCISGRYPHTSAVGHLRFGLPRSGRDFYNIASHLRANIGSLLARQLLCYCTGAACDPDSSRLRYGFEPPARRIRATCEPILAPYWLAVTVRELPAIRIRAPAIRIRATCDPDSSHLRANIGSLLARCYSTRAAFDPDSSRLRSIFKPPASQYCLTTGSSVLAQREMSRY
jgi:hypothetical protein